MTKRTIRILGTRGVPANHGGFETFAEHLALYLVDRGWSVTVYCQQDEGDHVYEDQWRGVNRVHIPVKQQGALGTIIFDWKSTLHTAKEPGLILTLGYNTAVFCLWYRLKGIANLINMDGIEWRRQKWGGLAKSWFYLNEWAGAWLGNHLIADHPAIKTHLSSRVNSGKITTIAYGAHRIEQADAGSLTQYGLEQNGYAILIARAEPENSILQIVRAWSRKKRGLKLVVLGKYDPQHAYQRAVTDAGSDEVIFPGAIYNTAEVGALRFFARLYIHGHQVGGTNPSLIEALAAGNAVLAHDNPFNRWVVGDEAGFFNGEDECASALEQTLYDDALLMRMRQSSRKRHAEAFTWERILSEYESLLLRHSATSPEASAITAAVPQENLSMGITGRLEKIAGPERHLLDSASKVQAGLSVLDLDIGLEGSSANPGQGMVEPVLKTASRSHKTEIISDSV
jgi:glycosyltransferase involved in cell wall biosynthesis